MGIESPDKQYRDLADETKMLRCADAVREERRLIKGGFFEEAGAFEKVVAFAKAVEAAGGKALLVGGSVRDELMGIPPKDYDIEVYHVKPGS